MNKNLILFDSFDVKEHWLWDSIRCLNSESVPGRDMKNNFEGLVLADAAFLPEHVTSIYDAYIRTWELEREFRDLYYAFIPVPELWMVMPYLERGAIFDMGVKKGEIYVRNPKEKRLVDHVEWLENGQIVRTDYYDRYGYVYKSDHMDEMGKLLETSYYTSDHKELLCLNHSNGIFGVLTQMGIMQYYHTAEDWIRAYLAVLCTEDRQIIVTSGRQKALLENVPARITDWSFLEKAKDSKEAFCYVSEDTEKYIAKKEEGRDILILTTSDQLEALETLTDALPQYSFHIAATTAFSPWLYELEKQKTNIHLYSTISSDKLEELLEKCTFYLDINRAYAYPDSIEKAALHGLLLMGFVNTAHQKQYFLEENLFDETDVVGMIQKIQQLSENPEQIKKEAAIQQKMQMEKMSRVMKGN